MSKNKWKKDTISEEAFNKRQMASSSAFPEEDSPGDTESDAGSEFEMGINYSPNENDEQETEGDEPGQIDFSNSGTKKKIPDTAKVVASELPSPWADLDTPSDTH